MKNNLKPYNKPLITGLILVTLLLTYFYRDNLIDFFEKAKNSPSDASKGSAVVPVNNTTATSAKDSVLSKGSTGESVRMLQKLLNDKHRQNTPTFIPLLVEDGNFGTLTESMLKKYTGKTSISINQLIQALM